MYLSLLAVFLFQTFSNFHATSADFLNEATFASSILKIPHFVLFYAPWCGHCKRLLISWNELVERSKDNNGRRIRNVKIAKVNCMEDTALCSEQNILAYPTMKLFHKRGVRRFNGRRSVAEFEIFIDKILSQEADDEIEGLVTLTAENFDGHITTGLHFVEFFAPWCVHCKRLEPTWKAIAKHFEKNPDITICKVDCTVESSKCQELRISGFPTLKLYKDGTEVDQYNAERTMEALLTYVNNNLNHYGLINLNSDDQQNSEQTKDESQENVEENVVEQHEDNVVEQHEENVVEQHEEGLEDLADMDHPVVDLIEQTFDMVAHQETTFVLFYLPRCKLCQQLQPIWETLGKQCQRDGGPTIARIDCSQFPATCQKYQVTFYPTLSLFKQGQRYNYDKAKNLESLYNFVKQYHDEL